MEYADRTPMELEYTASYTVAEVPALGVGNGESPISYKKQLANGELCQEVNARAIELIQSGEVMCDITDKDCGCIDGRPARTVSFIDNTGEEITREVSDASEHERYKVAGGGYVTATAMLLGSGQASGDIDADFRETAGRLAEINIYCGAHTGSHAHDTATDCGANDKMDTILENAVKYRDVIAANTEALVGVAGLDFNKDTFNSVIDEWSSVCEESDAIFGASSGASRLDVMRDAASDAQAKLSAEKPLAVSKDLAGDHNEDYIVLNYTEGKTFSQAKFRDMLGSDFVDLPQKNLAQAFVVDVPRIVELAEGVSNRGDIDFETALYAGVAYQLATASTLTDGTLRTFVVTK